MHNVQFKTSSSTYKPSYTGLENFYKKLSDRIICINQSRHGYSSYSSIEDDEGTPTFDFFLRGSGLLIEKGAILKAGSVYGVLSLHHGDNRYNKGGPVGFWEIVYN